MADNKSHHFVPRLVLKHFSCNNDKKSINIVHLPKARFIYGGALKSQCCHDYLYGRDGVMERGLGQIEGALASMIKHIIDTDDIGTDADTKLGCILVTLLQKSRTSIAGLQVDQLTDAFAKLALHGKIEREYLEAVQVGTKYAPAFSVAHSLSLGPLMYDLKHFLIKNETDRPFIISDNPVVQTNWFCRSRLPRRQWAGLGRAGIQTFMPVTPTYGILLHDQNVYRAECIRHKIVITKRTDIDALNELQVANAFTNAYFNTNIKHSDVNKYLPIWKQGGGNVVFTRMNPTDIPGRFKANSKSIYDDPDEGVKEELFHAQSPGLPKQIKLSAIKMAYRPKYFDNGSLASPCRDPAWLRVCKDFSGELLAGRIRMDEFWSFAFAHPDINQVGRWLREFEEPFRA